MPPNYQNGKVYAIRSHSTDKIYIGSTTQKLFKRLSSHVADYKRNHCVSSREIIGLGDYYIELLCDYPCERKEQLYAKEGEYIRQYKCKCVNRFIAGRSIKEFRENNKEQILEQNKQWRNDNKEKIIKYRDNNKEQLAEQKKKFYENNKEKILEQRKQRYFNNKEQIKEQEKNKPKYTCECGSIMSSNHKVRHIKTTKHINFINSSN